MILSVMMCRSRGFTLIELLVSIVIIGLLASVAFPLISISVRHGKETELRESLHEIRAAIDAYKHAAETGHITLKAGESGYPPTLDILMKGVPDAKALAKDGVTMTTGTLYFLRRIPRDPFFEDDSVPDAGTWGKRSYASSYDDPKEGDDVFDVYSLSTGIGLNDRPYRQW